MHVIDDYLKSFIPYMLNNIPVVLKNIGLDWVFTTTFNRNGMLNHELFKEYFASIIVPVEMVGSSYDTVIRQDMKISDFTDRVLTGETLYCKDWHISSVDGFEQLYEVPKCFTDDWLNAYFKWKSNESKHGIANNDYYFLYIGSRRTMTFMHHDVLCSHSWSVNIAGRKRWYLWPPSEVQKLHRNQNSTCGSKLELVVDGRPGQYSEADYPELKHAECYILEQGPGEALFVPSGWYHMVENLGVLYDGAVTVGNGDGDGDGLESTCTSKFSAHSTQNSNLTSTSTAAKESGTGIEERNADFTVSLNHNWISGTSVFETWRFLLTELVLVRKELWSFRSKFTTKNEVHTAPLQPVDISHSPSRGRCMNGDPEGMSECEWFTHCELVLRANARLGLRCLLELLSSRVLMMMLLRRAILAASSTTVFDSSSCCMQDVSQLAHGSGSVTMRSSSPLHLSKDLASNPVEDREHSASLKGKSELDHTEIRRHLLRADSSGTPSGLGWRALLCPGYDMHHITDEDISVCQALLAHAVHAPPDESNCLSNYIPMSADECHDAVIAVPRISLVQFLSYLHQNIHNKNIGFSEEINISQSPTEQSVTTGGDADFERCSPSSMSCQDGDNSGSVSDVPVQNVNLCVVLSRLHREFVHMSFPMNVMQFSVLQVLRILCDILSCPGVIEHLNYVYHDEASQLFSRASCNENEANLSVDAVLVTLCDDIILEFFGCKNNYCSKI